MRNISFSLTTPQFLARTKTVTRRLNWLDVKAGDRLMGCEKCMGRKPGEPLVRLGAIEVVSVWREPLNRITQADVIAEGFPNHTPASFVRFFCASHGNCIPSTVITRIQFRYLVNKTKSKKTPSAFPSGKKYGLIYADPAWQFDNAAKSDGQWGGAAGHYKTMTVEQICSLPVADIAARDCLLAMWHVPAMPREALAVVEAWGFRLVTMKGLCWHKLTATGLDHFGMGTLTRGNTEDCLFAVRGRPLRKSRSVRQIIHSAIREHSRKPDEARERLLQLLGEIPRIELFARQPHYGWDAWGNELVSNL